jgi:hypothetical protein
MATAKTATKPRKRTTRAKKAPPPKFVPLVAAGNRAIAEPTYQEVWVTWYNALPNDQARAGARATIDHLTKLAMTPIPPEPQSCGYAKSVRFMRQWLANIADVGFD